ncbi:MAG: hypothetical protein JHD09_04900, partial [Gemmataceae bacterium]|nr:hypothetical protein [Gemmataceae bacterium]
MKSSITAFAILLSSITLAVFAAEKKTNLNDIPSDIVVPKMIEGKPAAGKRVKHNWPEENNTAIHHALYLPENWTANSKWPVIIEFAGNGGYKNNLGDVSLGTVEGCSLGYGITKGRNAIWACLPFVDSKNKQNATNWWGDADATVEYTLRSVKNICEQYQGDADNIILAGFSRGSIACTYIGLRNDEIAKLWKGLICHSHIDGVTSWPYKDSDKESALVRWQRLKGRAAFISHEVSVQKAREFLTTNKVPGNFTFMDLPF